MKIAFFRKDLIRALSHHEVQAWAVQMSVMFSCGIPLVSILNAIGVSGLDKIASVSEMLSKKVTQGHSLSSAMQAAAPAFSPLVTGLVVLGERSGQLSIILERIAEREERRDRTERMIKGALAYPILLGVVSLGMALFMAVYMFPKLLPFLTSLGAELPWPTRMLIWGTENISVLFLITTIVLVGIWRFFSASTDSRLDGAREWLIYESPVIGRLNSDRVYADCFSDFHLLLEAGYDLLSTLKASRSPWEAHNRRVARCIGYLREGQDFSEAVQMSEIFPARYWMQIQSGDETGELPKMFGMLAAQLDESVSLRLASLIQIIEPMMFAVMGVITGFVVMATFLPMYSLASSLG